VTRAGGARRPPQASRWGAMRRPNVTPGVVILAVALVGSVIFALYAITVRDASQIPLLASGAVALGIAFIALAVYSVRATWKAGVAGRNGRALFLALAGGAAAIIGSGCLAGSIILFMLSRPPS
jgi:heme/copper-type cytochrome/quinol oxidase subunit 3